MCVSLSTTLTVSSAFSFLTTASQSCFDGRKKQWSTPQTFPCYTRIAPISDGIGGLEIYASKSRKTKHRLSKSILSGSAVFNSLNFYGRAAPSSCMSKGYISSWFRTYIITFLTNALSVFSKNASKSKYSVTSAHMLCVIYN